MEKFLVRRFLVVMTLIGLSGYGGQAVALQPAEDDPSTSVPQAQSEEELHAEKNTKMFKLHGRLINLNAFALELTGLKILCGRLTHFYIAGPEIIGSIGVLRETLQSRLGALTMLEDELKKPLVIDGFEAFKLLPKSVAMCAVVGLTSKQLHSDEEQLEQALLGSAREAVKDEQAIIRELLEQTNDNMSGLEVTFAAMNVSIKRLQLWVKNVLPKAQARDGIRWDSSKRTHKLDGGNGMPEYGSTTRFMSDLNAQTVLARYIALSLESNVMELDAENRAFINDLILKVDSQLLILNELAQNLAQPDEKETATTTLDEIEEHWQSVRAQLAVMLGK